MSLKDQPKILHSLHFNSINQAASEPRLDKLYKIYKKKHATLAVAFILRLARSFASAPLPWPFAIHVLCESPARSIHKRARLSPPLSAR